MKEKARKFAMDRHSEQRRKGGEPFFNHVFRVAQKVARKTKNEATIVAAYLHDVVEDGHATLEEISETFGEEVSYIVGLLTRDDNQSYREYIDSIAQSRCLPAILIKIADNEDNLDCVGDGAFPMEIEKSLKKRWLYSKRTLKLLL